MTRLGGDLTADKVLRALAAMGTPSLSLDEPTPDDLPYLLGCLLALTEAGLHQADPEALKLVTDGYRAQITGPGSGFAQVLHRTASTCWPCSSRNTPSRRVRTRARSTRQPRRP